jgi:hypothetical protein
LLQHQQQVATAVDRAKQVTMTELNAIIGVSTKQGDIYRVTAYKSVLLGCVSECLDHFIFSNVVEK